MAIFAVMSRKPNPSLDAAVRQSFPNSYKLGEQVWFLTFDGTARDLCDRLGIRKGGITGVVAMPTTGAYYGVASSDLWDWLRAAVERESNA